MREKTEGINSLEETKEYLDSKLIVLDDLPPDVSNMTEDKIHHFSG